MCFTRNAQVKPSNEATSSEAWIIRSRENVVYNAMSTVQGEEGGEKEGEEGEKTGKKAGEKQLRNQFNFSERASQTLNNPYRV